MALPRPAPTFNINFIIEKYVELIKYNVKKKTNRAFEESPKPYLFLAILSYVHGRNCFVDDKILPSFGIDFFTS